MCKSPPRVGHHADLLFSLPLCKESMEALQSQAVELQNIHCLGEQILASCHPDSIITLKSWISVTKTRYEEVCAWRNSKNIYFHKLSDRS